MDTDILALREQFLNKDFDEKEFTIDSNVTSEQISESYIQVFTSGLLPR